MLQGDPGRAELPLSSHLSPTTVSLVPSHLQNQGAQLTAARAGKLKLLATGAAKLPAIELWAPLLCFCVQLKTNKQTKTTSLSTYYVQALWEHGGLWNE